MVYMIAYMLSPVKVRRWAGAKVGIFSVIPRAQHEEVFPLFDPEHHLVDLRKILQQLFSVIARCASFPISIILLTSAK